MAVLYIADISNIAAAIGRSILAGCVKESQKCLDFLTQ